jgi:hypothetical protein
MARILHRIIRPLQSGFGSPSVATHHVKASGEARRAAAPGWKDQSMKRLITALFTWIERADERALEEYLARSANVAELEWRMREWETRGVK